VYFKKTRIYFHLLIDKILRRYLPEVDFVFYETPPVIMK